MRKVIFLLLTATVLWSCQNATFTIKGTVVDPDFEGANVYLQERTDDGLQTVETAVVQNGTFSFTGMADEKMRIVVLSGERQQRQTTIFLERGTIEIVFGDVITVSGTRINAAFHEFDLKRNELRQESSSVSARRREMYIAGMLTDELAAEMRAEQAQIFEQQSRLDIEFIRNNIGNAAGQFILQNHTNRESMSFELLEELLALTDDNFRAQPHIVRILTRIENARNVAIGQRFVDFTLQDLEENEVSLSDFAGRGNYVLVHFWATWCGPCLPRIPYLVRFYAQYKDRGFEIVSVSFDRTRDAWVAGVERLNMTWTQMNAALVSEEYLLFVWDLYAIRGIPHTVLLDREGVIIAKDLRDEELDNKLAELMP